MLPSEIHNGGHTEQTSWTIAHCCRQPETMRVQISNRPSKYHVLASRFIPIRRTLKSIHHGKRYRCVCVDYFCHTTEAYFRRPSSKSHHSSSKHTRGGNIGCRTNATLQRSKSELNSLGPRTRISVRCGPITPLQYLTCV